MTGKEPWGDQGDWVKAVTCPQCKNPTVVYNGNYFCALEKCGWAMGDRYTKTTDEIMHAYLAQRVESADKDGNAEELALMRWHLKNVVDREKARARKASGAPRKIGGRDPGC